MALVFNKVLNLTVKVNRTSFNYHRFRKYCQKSMLTAISSQIIKLMSTYFCKTHQYGGCNKSLINRASPNLVKSAIESADVPIKRFNLLFFLDREIIFIISNNIDVY